jgi:hypothetical protein
MEKFFMQICLKDEFTFEGFFNLVLVVQISSFSFLFHILRLNFFPTEKPIKRSKMIVEIKVFYFCIIVNEFLHGKINVHSSGFYSPQVKKVKYNNY